MQEMAMSDHTTPRFEAGTGKQDNDGSELPEHEFSAGTYGALADAVAELRQHLENASAVLKGDI